jgi:hypothetical protein
MVTYKKKSKTLGHNLKMRFHKTQTYLRTTQHQPTTKTTTIHTNTRYITMSSNPNTNSRTHNHNHTSPRWDNQHTFRTIVTQEEQDRARRQGLEVPFLESKLEMLNRHLLDTNHQLRIRHDEVGVLQRRVGELVQENDVLRSLHRSGCR